MEIAFFGRHCRFSAIVLAALLEHGHNPHLIVLPGHVGSGARIVQQPTVKPRLSLIPAESRVTTLPTVSSLAWSAGSKVAEVSHDLLDSIPDRYLELSKGIIVSACYPWRLPDSVLDKPSLGAVNVHPSLLPAHRGPDPVFWTLHAGDRTTGATIHQMTSRLDAGPVLAQRSIKVPLRSRYNELEQQTAVLGAQLLCESLDAIQSGTMPAVPQSEPQTPAESFPDPASLQIDSTWTAERAFRFVFGVSGTYGPVIVHTAAGAIHNVDDALALHPGRRENTPALVQDGRISIQFADGVVDFQLFQHSSPSPAVGRGAEGEGHSRGPGRGGE